MQTDSFTVLVGPDQCAYKIPQSRLTMHSSVFERMCSAPFLESTERVIKLPEEDPHVFDDFYDWMHSSKPHVDFNKGAEAVFDLAIFAEKYQICHLKNQIADILNKQLENDILNAETLDQVYSSVPDGAVLRQLCSSILERQVIYYSSYHRARKPEDFYKEYEPVFALHANLGRDFFRWTVSNDHKPCTFHDHSNITNPVETTDNTCPYSDIHFVAPQSITPSRTTGRASKKPKKKHTV